MDQVRILLRHPDLIAPPIARSRTGPTGDPMRRPWPDWQNSASGGTRRSSRFAPYSSVAQQDDGFLAAEIKRLKGELRRWNVRFGNWNPHRSQVHPWNSAVSPTRCSVSIRSGTCCIRRNSAACSNCWSNGSKSCRTTSKCGSAAMASSRLSQSCDPQQERKYPAQRRRSQDLLQKYPGMTVFREDNAVVVRIPVNFRRRNGRQMVLTCGGEELRPSPTAK